MVVVEAGLPQDLQEEEEGAGHHLPLEDQVVLEHLEMVDP